VNSRRLHSTLTQGSAIGVVVACAASAGAHAAVVPQHVDPVALATKAVEALGLVFSIQLNNNHGRAWLVH
jgi:methionine-rich copper-binding protein CopC